jgi:hypothetical protein
MNRLWWKIPLALVVGTLGIYGLNDALNKSAEIRNQPPNKSIPMSVKQQAYSDGSTVVNFTALVDKVVINSIVIVSRLVMSSVAILPRLA